MRGLVFTAEGPSNPPRSLSGFCWTGESNVYFIYLYSIYFRNTTVKIAILNLVTAHVFHSMQNRLDGRQSLYILGKKFDIFSS